MCHVTLATPNKGIVMHHEANTSRSQLVLWRKSHARTVVRECRKGDDESLREKGKFAPPPKKNPLTDGYQKLCR